MTPAQILLIEDNPADVMLVAMALKENGIEHTLTRYASGKEALRVLALPGSEPRPDAILLDLNTPETDGFSALIQLKLMPRLARVPIAVLTTSRARKDRQRVTIQGALYIEKPSQLREFLAVVGTAVKEMLATG